MDNALVGRDCRIIFSGMGNANLERSETFATNLYLVLLFFEDDSGAGWYV